MISYTKKRTSLNAGISIEHTGHSFGKIHSFSKWQSLFLSYSRGAHKFATYRVTQVLVIQESKVRPKNAGIKKKYRWMSNESCTCNAKVPRHLLI